MYNQQINDLIALFKGKREKAKQYLMEVIKKDPYNLTNELLNAPDKVWPYVSQIIRSNPKGVFLAILRKGMLDSKAERFLTEIGYEKYISSINEFRNELSRANGYRREGIPMNYDAVYREFLSGNVKKALNDIKILNTTGRKLEVMLNRWKELKSLADKAGEEIPDITEAIRNLDMDEAQKILNSIDKEFLRNLPKWKRKKENVREKILSLKEEFSYPVDDLLKELDSIPKGKDFERMEEIEKEAESIGRHLEKLMERYEELKKLSKKAGEETPSINDAIEKGDLESAEKILNSIDEGHLKKRAGFMEKHREADRTLKEIEWVQGGTELRERLDKAKNVDDISPILDEIKELDEKVRKILSLHDDEEIRNLMKESIKKAEKEAVLRRGLESLKKPIKDMYELFTEEYSNSVNSVHGFEAGRRIYILSGGWDNKLHVYDETGRELFTREYSGWVYTVHGFEAGEKAYILVGGLDKKLHVYDENGRELFTKEHSDGVYSVYGFEVNGRIYILVSGADKKLYVYDENGREMFTRKYSGSVRSIYGFEAGGRVYILVGGDDRKLHVYDETGREMFTHESSNYVASVHGFEANGKIYILAGGGNRKLHVYDETGRDVFTKEYDGSVLSVHGFEANGMGNIIVGGKNRKLHVYDETGRELFTRKYSDWVRTVYGFQGGKNIYIFARGKDRKLHVYDETGREMFTRGYSGSVRSIYGFEAGGRIYILGGGDDKKLHVYVWQPPINTEELMELHRWANNAGIETNFYKIMRIALDDPYKAIEMADKLMEELNNMKEEYEEMKERWEQMEVRYREAGLKIQSMPMKYDDLKEKLREMENSNFKAGVSVNLSGDITENLWSKTEIVVKNDGGINLEDVSIEVQSRVVEAEGTKYIGNIKKGEEKKIPIRIKSKDAGYVPVEILVKYRNPLTEKDEEMKLFPEIFVAKEGISGSMGKKKKRAERHINIPKEEEKIDLTGIGDFFSYTIGEHLGSGGFSDVYKAEDENGEEYAMKLPLNVDLKGEKTYYLPEKLLQSFIKEARIWNTLTERNIPGIVQLYGFGVRPFPWFVMDLCDESLAERMNKMELREKIEVLIKVLNTLNEIHYLGIVHRDIKPQNILFKDEEPLLTDFGLGKALNKASKSSQGYSGTVEYSSPEQFNRKLGGSDRRTDIWQVGVLAYEMLTGNLPFEGEDITEIMFAVLNEEPEHPSDVNSEISRELGDAIMRALKKRKGNRWQSAMEFKKAIEEVL